MTSRSPFRWSLVVLGGALAIVFYRLLLGEVFFWGLPSLQFYPWREYAWELLRAGQLPLWNPYNGAGAPLLANYQSGLLYPLNWLGLVLPLASAMSITAVLHLFIAGWGMWRFTGRLGVSPLGQGISALAFGMTSYLVARLGTFPLISAAAWLPWLLWAALGVLSRPNRRGVAWLATFSALQLLAGHAQTSWYSLLLVGVFALWWFITHRPVNRVAAALLVAGLALGALVAAMQLFGTAELLGQSQRSGGVDYDFAMNFSYSPLRTLNLLSYNVFGNPGDGSYVTEGAFFEDAVYIGLLPLIAALTAGVVWLSSKLRRRERPAYFASVPLWLVVVAVAFIFALGKNSPIFPFFYDNIPTFKFFQAPVRWHLWTVFGLSVLAGIGAGTWGRGKWLFFWTRLATAGGIGAALLAWLAPNFLPPDVAGNDGVRVFIQAITYTGLFGALAGALTLLQPENTAGNRYRLWMLAALVVVAVDLGFAVQGLNPTVPASFYTPQWEYEPSRAYWDQTALDDVLFNNGDAFLRLDDYRIAVNRIDAYRTSDLPNLNLLDHHPLLNNFDPLLVGHFAAYTDLIEAAPEYRDTLLQAAGVSVVYSGADEAEVLLDPADTAWMVTNVCWHPEGTSLAEMLLRPDWQPLAQVNLIGAGDCPTIGSVYAEPHFLMAQVESGEITIPVGETTGGWLVLAQTDYPGWEASIDGKPAEIRRANGAFQAVAVPNGAQIVTFSYHPWWLWPGAFLSIVGVVLLALLFRSTPLENMDSR
ncbi:MAG: YfhO family protein [Anaerolineaceae bacterium]|nr:YfhO family protein [Anaerolineaceae bacterium]